MIMTPKKRDEVIRLFNKLPQDKKIDFLNSFNSMSILANCIEIEWQNFGKDVKVADPTINRKISSVKSNINDVKRYLYSLFTPIDRDVVEIDKPASVLEFLKFYMVLPTERLDQINSALHRELQKIPELQTVIIPLEKHWVVVYPDGYADVYTISKSEKEATKKYEELSGAKWSKAKKEGFIAKEVEVSFFSEK